ncbi:TolC family protein [Terracidiphilus sp.]|uniref:TolC family protein n=1 Tax=Terracidiphilus sp. TaxID=1964191 RepID=UPI003C787FF1
MMKRTRVRLFRSILLGSFAIICSGALSGQTASQPLLPDAPPSRLIANAPRNLSTISQVAAQAPETTSGSSAPGQPTHLTRIEAEQMAIKNNPRVTVGRLLALAQHQVVRELRSAELPSATGNITAEDAEDGSRISAGSLTASRLFTHAGAGATATQLITDFGRTKNLVASSKLQEKAQNASTLATTEDIVIVTDQAFYNTLQAQALLKVAEQNVTTRNTTDTQVSAMTKNKLKSTLDLSFADVNLSQAKLLLLDAQNNADSTMVALDDVLGLDRQQIYDLDEDNGPLHPPPPNADQLIQLALQQRPDLQALNYSQQAAVKFSHAQHDQMLPTITAAGTAGTVPIRPGEQYYTTNWWGAAGVNMNIPIFNGFLYSAQAKEATIRAQAASEQSRGLRDHIVRDVRTAWLAANTAFQRVAVTAELLKEANLALGLAQTRYQLGLSSIVELSQAEFQQTDAAIGNTNAQYQYRLALATLNYQIGATP